MLLQRIMKYSQSQVDMATLSVKEMKLNWRSVM